MTITLRLSLGTLVACVALTAAAVLTLATLSVASVAPTGQSKGPSIEWDRTTLVCLQPGSTYGRMIRLPARKGILCSYESGGKSWVRRSRDEGRTWGAPVLVKEISDAAAANPELLLLQSGRLLLFYNQRPQNNQKTFAIGFCTSDDDGQTWQVSEKLLYEAGTLPENGCWEPAAIQLPSGEIQLFFANEFPYPTSADQEITLLRSRDKGATWSSPQTFSYRAGHRDGMPVPLQLQNKSVVVAIEDNGLVPGAKLQPAILSALPKEKEKQVITGYNRDLRWGAIQPPLPGSVYAGAPYLRQMPTGETILSCQSDESATEGTKRTRPQMVVYVGDSKARNFRNPSVPFPTEGDGEGLWNALFVKDRNTITAISDTTVNGIRGLWAIDGRLRR